MKTFKQWISTAVPVKDPKEAPVEPHKREKPKEDEWSPKPKIVPQPKNRRVKGGSLRFPVKENYEDHVHPKTKEFWSKIRSNKHVFSNHPLFAQYGDEMSRDGWQHLQPGEEGHELHNNMIKCLNYIKQVEQIESKNKEKLEALAVELTEKLWGIPSERLEANLTGLSGSFDKNFESDDDYDSNEDLEQGLKDQVNKRLTMNLLVHGSSMHTLKTAHAGAQLMSRNNVERFIDQELNKINPNLVKLYTKIAEITGKQFWLVDIEVLKRMGMSNAAVASSRVDYSKNNPKVIAKGLIFPFLVHELFKGTAELLTHFGLEDLDKDSAKKVIKKADDIRHEPYLAMAGPALWRKILKVKPKQETLANIIRKFSKMQPKDLHSFLSKVWEAKEEDELKKVEKEFEEIMN
jgi:hypothetical protein